MKKIIYLVFLFFFICCGTQQKQLKKDRMELENVTEQNIPYLSSVMKKKICNDTAIVLVYVNQINSKTIEVEYYVYQQNYVDIYYKIKYLKYDTTLFSKRLLTNKINQQYKKLSTVKLSNDVTSSAMFLYLKDSVYSRFTDDPNLEEKIEYYRINKRLDTTKLFSSIIINWSKNWKKEQDAR
ncbi:MAG: hypothetical protein GY827_00215 [Cytophagales bacterium]|nr:hypothetical protein [Cytophagales bacterium]